MRYRKIPVEITAKQWTGDDDSWLHIQDWTSGGFRKISEGVYTAEVYDVLHDTWVKLRTGDYVIRGITGEYYPCEQAVFIKTYVPS